MADQKEIRKLLDDPNVTPETKKGLVRALAGAGGGEEDVKRYAQANGVEVPDDPGFWSYAGAGVLAPLTGGASLAYVGGKEIAADRWKMAGGEADKLVRKAGEERELGSTRKVLNETGDFTTSDELLDAGAPGLRFFEKFIPLYSQAASLAGHGGQCPDLRNDIYRNYDEVREIDLGKFREDAEKINDTVEKLDGHQNELGRSFSSLGTWRGDAANAANAYNGKFLGTAGGFVQDAKGAPGTITAGATAIQKHVKDFAQKIHDMHSEKCGNLTVEEAKDNIRIAQGNIDEGDFSFGDWFSGVPGMLKGHLVGIILGGPVGGIIGSVIGLANHAKDVRKRLIDEAKQKLKVMCQELDSKKQAFDGYCQAVQQGVQSDYDTMFQALEGQLKDKPFGQVGDPPSFTGDGGDKGGGDKSRDGSAGGGGSTGGGGAGGGGGTPEVPKPENPLDTDGDGKPDGVKKPEEDLETVTVTSGDNAIKVTEPDANGHVKLTVDTPKGEPRTYDLDFSKDPEAMKALIEAGGLKITAGVDPKTAGINLTVDDGDGTPDSYSVEFGEDRAKPDETRQRVEVGSTASTASPDNSGTTTASGASMVGSGAADSVLGSPGSAEGAWSSLSANAADNGNQFGLADTNASQAGEAGSATLPSMQDGAPAQTAPMGGGMMGGGMAGGGHQQGGGDSERGPSQWRTTGSLFDDDRFDDDSALSHVRGVLGDNGEGR